MVVQNETVNVRTNSLFNEFLFSWAVVGKDVFVVEQVLAETEKICHFYQLKWKHWKCTLLSECIKWAGSSKGKHQVCANCGKITQLAYICILVCMQMLIFFNSPN